MKKNNVGETKAMIESDGNVAFMRTLHSLLRAFPLKSKTTKQPTKRNVLSFASTAATKTKTRQQHENDNSENNNNNTSDGDDNNNNNKMQTTN